MRFEDYPITISPIAEDEGYLVSIPDLPGCIADGQTIEEAISEARDAWRAWMTVELEDKGCYGAPSSITVDRGHPLCDMLGARLSG